MILRNRVLVPVVGLLSVGSLLIGCQQSDGKKAPRLRNGQQVRAQNVGTAARNAGQPPVVFEGVSHSRSDILRQSTKGSGTACTLDVPDSATQCRAVLAQLTDSGAQPIQHSDGSVYQQHELTDPTLQFTERDGKLVAEYTNRVSNKTKPELKTIYITSNQAAVPDVSVIQVDAELNTVNVAQEIRKLRLTDADHVLVLTDISELVSSSDTRFAGIRQNIESAVQFMAPTQEAIRILSVENADAITEAIAKEQAFIDAEIVQLMFSISGGRANNIEIESIQVNSTAGVTNLAAEDYVVVAGSNSKKIVLKNLASIKSPGTRITVTATAGNEASSD
jgi:hypothetical protein